MSLPVQYFGFPASRYHTIFLFKTEWWSRRESNLHLPLRRGSFYPLNYRTTQAEDTGRDTLKPYMTLY